MLHTPIARWVHRTILLQPPPQSRIVQEDICIIPLSDEAQSVRLFSCFYNLPLLYQDFSIY